jgi:hypothetical protein
MPVVMSSESRAECAAIAAMLRAHAAANPAHDPSKPTTIVGPDSTTFEYIWARTTAPGCHVVVSGSDSASRAAMLGDVDSLLINAGWLAADSLYSADGPDGSVLGFLKSQTLCVREGSWDGGDDADSTYVPSPNFKLEVRCAPRRSDDRPGQ